MAKPRVHTGSPDDVRALAAEGVDEPPAAEPPCICVRQPYARFQGDAPFREPSVEVLEDSGADASWWRARCRRCGTTWMVAYIPGGGIYGDFAWDREEAEP